MDYGVILTANNHKIEREMEPIGREDETIENKRKRLIFRSDHRGTKEMDIILGRFARAYVPEMTEGELEHYDELLTHNDPDLYNWITGKEDAPANIAETSVFKTLMESNAS